MQQKATYNEKIRKALQEREEKKKILIRKLKRISGFKYWGSILKI